MSGLQAQRSREQFFVCLEKELNCLLERQELIKSSWDSISTQLTKNLTRASFSQNIHFLLLGIFPCPLKGIQEFSIQTVNVNLFFPLVQGECSLRQVRNNFQVFFFSCGFQLLYQSHILTQPDSEWSMSGWGLFLHVKPVQKPQVC